MTGSLVNDGSATLLVTTSEIATACGWRPRPREHTMSVVGDDPVYLLTAIIPATAKLLARAGLSIDVIDAFEVNEAFASVVLCWRADTAADRIAQTAAAMLLEVKLATDLPSGKHKLPDTPCPNARRAYSGSSSRPSWRWVRPRFSE